jgi:hypothetical protein
MFGARVCDTPSSSDHLRFGTNFEQDNYCVNFFFADVGTVRELGCVR